MDLQYINSALVSAQNRQRFYVHNILNVEQPEDKNILMCDIIKETDLKPYNPKGNLTRIRPNLNDRYNGLYQIGYTDKNNGQACRVYDIHGKSVTLRGEAGGGGGKTGIYMIDNKMYSLNQYGAAKLQTMPEHYADCVSDDVACGLYGNGWTAEVIIHILKHINIPLDEEIQVLSMYDGIGTGRYCFDKLGYKNITYKAYEIDKYAKQVANKNYPDIMQCGDAFDVRNNSWCYEKQIMVT